MRFFVLFLAATASLLSKDVEIFFEDEQNAVRYEIQWLRNDGTEAGIVPISQSPVKATIEDTITQFRIRSIDAFERTSEWSRLYKIPDVEPSKPDQPPVQTKKNGKVFHRVHSSQFGEINYLRGDTLTTDSLNLPAGSQHTVLGPAVSPEPLRDVVPAENLFIPIPKTLSFKNGGFYRFIAKNSGRVIQDFLFRVDRTPPKISFKMSPYLYSANGVIIHRSTVVKVEAIDSLSGTENVQFRFMLPGKDQFQIWDEAKSLAEYPEKIEQAVVVEYFATDYALNSSKVEKQNVIIDFAPPVISSIQFMKGKVTLTVKDISMPVKYRISSTEGISTGSIGPFPATEGSTLHIYLEDAGGNSAEQTITVRESP